MKVLIVSLSRASMAEEGKEKKKEETLENMYLLFITFRKYILFHISIFIQILFYKLLSSR